MGSPTKVLAYCAMAAGCLANSCFYCTDACLFFRTFATPESDTVYEVFECTSWRFSVDISISLHYQNKVINGSLTIHPGQLNKWRNFQLTLIGIVSPPSPILDTRFLTDGSRTIMVSASSSGQPIPGTLGSLQCPNAEEARAFKTCHFPHDICTCYPQDEKASCACSDLIIEPIFEDKERLLPLSIHGISLMGSAKDIYAEFTSIASLELQVSVQDLKIVYGVHYATCLVTPVAFKGCYSCRTGAKLSYVCRASSGEALAKVKCGEDVLFSTKCTEPGLPGIATLSFKRAQIARTCVFSCPGGYSNFNFSGTLIFINKNRMSNVSSIGIALPGEKSFNTGIDFWHLFNWLRSYWSVMCLSVSSVWLFSCL